MTYGVMAAHMTIHPKVKPSAEIGASASGDSNPESDVVPRGVVKAFGSNEGDVAIAAGGNDTI
eukprot:CAMPEP_0194120312 /NCGR_PEP_ID=MMETSP0150-20130528/42993_1 /TAXON_ID=122233 /ORGANISM="Chaetoceros debilis, Strain MM31A-1" /LENGTH=62 /DNA_ID=CAMNT_0038812375 /DNA_START=146 /DNA_END=331 /DNA_ORIENTATION=-